MLIDAYELNLLKWFGVQEFTYRAVVNEVTIFFCLLWTSVTFLKKK